MATSFERHQKMKRPLLETRRQVVSAIIGAYPADANAPPPAWAST